MNKEDIIKQIEQLDLKKQSLQNDLLKLDSSYKDDTYKVESYEDDIYRIAKLVSRKIKGISNKQENKYKLIVRTINDSLKKIMKLSEENRITVYFYVDELASKFVYTPKSLVGFFDKIIIEAVDNFYINHNNRSYPDEETRRRIIDDVKRKARYGFGIDVYNDGTNAGVFRTL